MPDRNDFNIPAENNGAVLKFNVGAAGSVPGTLLTMGCPQSANFNKTVNQVDDNLTGWCISTAASGTIAGFTPGTIQSEITVNFIMVIDEAAYIAMDGAVGSDYSWVQRELANVAATATLNRAYGGYITGFNEQLPESGPSTVAMNFRANEEIDVA